MIADIDRARFASDTLDWLERKKLSYRHASTRYPGLNPALLSRACNCKPLSAGNMLLVCKAMQKDPTLYLVLIDRRQQNQTVTAIGKRETSGAAS
jgi:hypothetical protein